MGRKKRVVPTAKRYVVAMFRVQPDVLKFEGFALNFNHAAEIMWGYPHMSARASKLAKNEAGKIKEWIPIWIPITNPRALGSDDFAIMAHDAYKVAEIRYNISMLTHFEADKLKKMEEEEHRALALMLRRLIT